MINQTEASFPILQEEKEHNNTPRTSKLIEVVNNLFTQLHTFFSWLITKCTPWSVTKKEGSEAACLLPENFVQRTFVTKEGKTYQWISCTQTQIPCNTSTLPEDPSTTIELEPNDPKQEIYHFRIKKVDPETKVTYLLEGKCRQLSDQLDETKAFSYCDQISNTERYDLNEEERKVFDHNEENETLTCVKAYQEIRRIHPDEVVPVIEKKLYLAKVQNYQGQYFFVTYRTENVQQERLLFIVRGILAVAPSLKGSH